MIVPLALRMCATRALETAGATLAELRVFDSAITPLDEMVSKEPKPMIVVSTEDDSGDPGGSDFNSGDRQVQLVIETAMSQAVPLPDGEGVEVLIPNSDAGLELTLAILSRQIGACLFGRGGGVWGDVFRQLTSGTAEVISRRGIQSKDGARLAARQTVYTIRTLAEPAYGQEIDERSPLAAFLAAVEADAQTAPLGPVLRQAIEGRPVGWPAVYSAASMIAGLTDEMGRAIGIAPLDPAGGLAVEATIDLDPDFGADPWVIDEDEIEAQLPEGSP